MKLPTIPFVILGAFLFIVPASVMSEPGDPVPGEFIVLCRDDCNSADVAKRHGHNPDQVYSKALSGFAGKMNGALRKQMEADPDVVRIVPNREVVGTASPYRDPFAAWDKWLRGQREYLQNIEDLLKDVRPENPARPSTQTIPSGVLRIGAAPGELAFDGRGVGIAVIDTGIDRRHVDLRVSATYFSAFENQFDDNGHGTHVAGLAAAIDNDRFSVGVAPRATLYSVKVLNEFNRGVDSDIIAGLDWVAENAQKVRPAIKVVNMSLGRPGALDDNPAYRQSIQTLTENLGITVVVSAGNTCGEVVKDVVPAGYPEVIAVASTSATNGPSACDVFLEGIVADSTSQFATAGAYDPDTRIGVTISAPGTRNEFLNTDCIAFFNEMRSTGIGGGINIIGGSSMSAGITSGVVALLYQQADESGVALTSEMVRSKIMQGAEGVGVLPLINPICGFDDGDAEGILSAPGALAAP